MDFSNVSAATIIQNVLVIWCVLYIIRKLLIPELRAIKRAWWAAREEEPAPEEDNFIPDWQESEEPPPPEPPEKPYRPPRPAISLQELTLLVEDQAGKMKLTRLIRVDIVKSMRPAIRVKVSKKSLVGREVRLKVELIDPKGVVRYAYDWVVELKKGVNYIIPPTWLDVESTMSGGWKAMLYLGSRPWAELSFSVTNRRLDVITGVVGRDGELLKSERDFKDLTGISIDDLLSS